MIKKKHRSKKRKKKRRKASKRETFRELEKNFLASKPSHVFL